ncbi:putative non-specific serine/threonine protein kinase [Rosa chinensis]|uniref:Putative non-specific serine/threonine protein kinase n=1 Tax=Rosa chinensis TaxID=74649 RepID=A0A2P6SH79_ROSCH|nr:receptor-like protein EIX2 [Rosa chinensis]PRQ58040.1 putative non-specific serine/threonine protein kinase [Rosa chinensis]
MELGRWLKHAYAISIVLLLHINASLSLGHHHANVTARCLERERDALLAIKGDLVDEYNLLSSWGSEAKKRDCCGWERVHCDHQTGHVIQLHLNGEPLLTYLQGEISPKIIELQHLEYLDLSHNPFRQIPAIICSLFNLRHLDLSFNFIGFSRSKIPELIGNLTNLRYLDMSANFLGDETPYHQLGNLTHLQYLNLGYNDITHGVENLHWLPHLSSLKYLDLSSTNLIKVSDWLETINKLPNLRNLTLRLCSLPPPTLSTLSHINSSNSLVSVDLSKNPAVSSSIFKWLCNYNTTLVHIDLSFNQLSGLISNAFSNMSSLAYLDLSSNQLSGLIPDVFKNKSSLAYLDLSNNQLEGGIPASIGQLCNLRTLAISDNRLHGQFSEFVQTLSICTQNSLERLYLSQNDLAGSLPNLANFQSLKELYLSENQLSGIIPDSIGKLSSLKTLDLEENRLSGMIPESIGQMSLLRELYLQGNQLSGMIPESIGQMSMLIELYLQGNQLSGMIPESIGKLSALHKLDLSGNRLNGTVPKSIGQCSELSNMNLSKNSLEGVISEVHFSKLSALEALDLSYNPLVFNVNSDWVPPFQLGSLSLRSCQMGTYFPNWLRTQQSLSKLDISYAGISNVLPSWFWSLFGNIHAIDLSHNQLRGTFESSKLKVSSSYEVEVHFGSNQFEGSIPSSLLAASYLDLSNNKFSDMTSLCVTSELQSLKFLNLSGNHVSGEIPDCWRHLVSLKLLDLSSNAFSGKIPTTIGTLFRMETLKLRSNKLVGELPSSLKNCKSLKVIDLGDNQLLGSVPEWLGVSFPNLVILMLRSNQFRGSLPSQLCHLTHIQILDFSVNEISGAIPKCLNNLTSLTREGNSSLTIRHSFHPSYAQAPGMAEAPSPADMAEAEAPMMPSDYYEDDATFMWKGIMSSYKNTLGLVKRIDLSSNRLTGEIPSEITHLVGLVSLNLSRNNLTGQIPLEIGKLKSLDSLDLSSNKIGGRIPTSLARIDRLTYMNLSYNNLSGEIPTGTQLQSFDPSFYAGNPQLCGRPLEACNPEGTGGPNVSSDQEDPDELITPGFYISLGLGFAVGFWVVCGSLIFKRSWRYAYYNFLNALNDWLYVRVALIRRQLKDMLSGQS